MPNWKRVLVSGSDASLNSLNVTTNVVAQSFTGSLFGTSSWANNAVSSSFPITVTGSTLRSVSPAGGVGGSSNSSIFIGAQAGLSAVSASNSNFLGGAAGRLATRAFSSNFIGAQAGLSAVSASNSNFLGALAGQSAANAYNSNFLGGSAGRLATNANNSNFLGALAGQSAINASDSNFLGSGSGNSATDANNSNFLGNNAGRAATTAFNSNFLGNNAGYQATFAGNSNFLGNQAGYQAAFAINSNFIGNQAGYQATDANSSNFLGNSAGGFATNAYQSNFLGTQAGSEAVSASNSNFLGNQAGRVAYIANDSNFLGTSAGFSAVNANNSNFLGSFAGYYADNANNSNFLGSGSGFQANNASYSTLIGYNVGRNVAGAGLSIKSNNIIIGTNITLENERQDSINFGGLIFGTGSYSTTTGNPFSGSANGRIGINQPLPTFNLDVSGSGRYTNGLQVTGSLNAPIITGSIFGTASWAQNAVTASFFSGSIANAISASYAASASWAINSLTASYAVRFNVSQSLTASGLRYPTADNGEESFIQTDGAGSLSLQYVKTVYEEMYNGEATTIVKGTPVYISGSVGANARVFRAEAANPLKMPVVYVSADNIASGAVGRGIALGLIKGVDTTGYPAGTEIFVGPSGGWTSTRPTGSAAIQILGYITKEGAGGQGVILNPGPVNLPNIASGNVWIGNGNSAPIAISSASLFVNSASFALTSSNVLGGTTSYVPLWRGATALTSSVMYQSGSNVGIGTILPAYKLDISGDLRTTTDANFATTSGKVGIGTTSPAYKLTINTTAASENIVGIATTSNLLILGINASEGHFINSNTNLAFGAHGSEAIRITSGGNVGIGTKTPTAKLHVTGSTGGIFEVDGVNSINALYVSASGNVGINTITPTEKLTVRGNGAKIRIESESNPSSYFATMQVNWDASNPFVLNSQGFDILGSKTNIGNVSDRTTYLSSYYDLSLHAGATTTPSSSNARLYISGSGNVGIGTTSPNAKLDVNGNAIITGSLTVTQGITGSLFGTSSWARNALTASFAPGYVSGSGTTNYIPKWTGTSTQGDSSIFDNGNIGIGTANPLTSFVVSNAGGNGYEFDPLNSFISSINRSTSVWTPVTFRAGSYKFNINNSNDAVIIQSNGNVQMNTGTDAGYKLDVNGTLRNTTGANFATTSGNVGIGTSTPTSKLHVSGGSIFVDNANGSVIVRNGDATNQQQIRLRMSGNDGILDVTRNSGTQPNLIFGTEATERMRITAAGFVGIGTTAPDSELQVGSTATNGNRTIRITDNGYGLLLSGGGGLTNNYIKSLGVTIPLYFLAGNSNDANYIFSSTGRVGIGTTSPNAKLDVNGNTIISGSFTVVTGSAVELQVTNTGVKIGSVPTDNHTVTGSLGITGSLTVNNYTSTGARPLKEVNVSGSIIASNNSTILLDTSTLNSKLLMSYGASNNFPDNYAGFTVDGNRSLRVASNNVEQFIFGWNGNFAAVGFAGIPGSPPARFYAVGAGTTSATKGLQITDVNTKDLFVVYDNGATHMSGSLTVTGSITSYVNFNTQTTNYTLQLGDISKIVEINSGSAATVTVPSSSVVNFPIGSQITIAGYGAGQVSFTTGSSGVNIRSAGNRLRLLQQYSFATITKRGTDEWYLFGDLTV